MTEKSPTDTFDRSTGFPAPGERLVYVMPQEAIQAFADDEMSLLDLWRILWHGKWIITGITTIFAVASIVHVLIATEWYRAEVLLSPAEASSSQPLSGTLGGLATLAGVSVGGGDNIESLAVLRSRDFAAAFIDDLNLLPFFFPDSWDADSNAWRTDGGAAPPDIRDGIKYFTDNVRSVTEERDTGLVTLAIEWKDPDLAADWANLLVERLNDRMRQDALAEAETNVTYLQNEIGRTNVVTLQQSIGSLMESELQKLMLARGNEEFAFRIIDRAQVPKVRSRPRRTLTVVLATFVGGMVSVLLVLVRHSVKNASSKKNRAVHDR
jgi:uncharacterized protein involved in exopolysaccharide biosynthesis